MTAELDYLLGRRFGPPARRAFLEDLAARRYADLDAGLADPSLVVLARRLGTRRILTPST